MSKLSKAISGKSKTINFNAAGAALVPLLQAFGVNLDPVIVSSGFMLMNWILRFFTAKALGDK